MFSEVNGIVMLLKLTRGLEYLHERCNPPVIHRDLKSSNVLLDSNLNAKVNWKYKQHRSHSIASPL